MSEQCSMRRCELEADHTDWPHLMLLSGQGDENEDRIFMVGGDLGGGDVSIWLGRSDWEWDAWGNAPWFRGQEET